MTNRSEFAVGACLVAAALVLSCRGQKVEPSPSETPKTGASRSVALPLEFRPDGFRYAASEEHAVIVYDASDVAKVKSVPDKKLVVSYEPLEGVDGPLCGLRAIPIDALYIAASLQAKDLQCLSELEVGYLGALIDSRHDAATLTSSGVRGFSLTTSFQGHFPREAAALAGSIDVDRLEELSQLPKLRWLDLSSAQNLADEHLATLQALTTLRWLSLEETSLSQDAVRDFRAKVPALTVHFSPPR